MVDQTIQMMRIARPVHWVKNLALFGAIFLTGTLFEKGLLENVILAFFAFSFATSATYIFNDLMDAPSDRMHPTKRFRPFASGKLPVFLGVAEMLGFALLSLYIASLLNQLFLGLILTYLSIQFV
jgi:4-hydroxybenzoate polyprenyltransferase